MATPAAAAAAAAAAQLMRGEKDRSDY